MKNFVQNGEKITFPIASIKCPNNPPKSGDPAVAAKLSGVVQDDAVAGGDAVVVTKGVFNVSVVAGAAMAVGAVVFIATATAVLSDTNTGTPFGVLLDAIAGASTVTRRVKLIGGAF